MRKIINIAFITVLLFGLSAFTAYADMGSKPRVQIDIKNPPQEKYYLDLLHQYDNPDYNGNTVWPEDPMFTALYNYNADGWVPALAQGTPMPIWGNLEPDENGRHIIGYFGVPDEFKIIIITESGQIRVSDIIKRKTMEVSLTLDYSDMSYTIQPVWLAIITRFLSTWTITLSIEFIVLLLFFKSRQNLKQFLLMNTLTQIFFATFISYGFLFGGTFGVYLWFPLIELIIGVFEMWYCNKYFTGRDSLTRMCYAAVANLASGMCTFFSLGILMDTMFNLIR